MRPAARKVAQYLLFHPEVFVQDPAYQLGTVRYAPEISEVIWDVKQALKRGISPIKCEHATSDTYFLIGEEEKPLAVFKLNYYMREYAAYRLDHKGFAGVPPTAITTLSHPMFGGAVTGSCQLFIEDGVSAVEIERKCYQSFTPSPIRRIAQLDIRLINEDRHTSNILIRDKKEAIPIDHGFSLPSLLGSVNYVWVLWDQAATPFSEEERSYIANIDPERDRAFLLEEVGLKEEIANRLYVSTMLLKLGMIHGFYPNQIGDIISKTYNRKAPDSKFEILIERLLDRDARDWTTFTQYVNEEIEIILEEYEANQHANLSLLSGVSREEDDYS